MKTLVAQLGARRHYAVPRAFEQYGKLHRFCTDLYLDSGRLRRLLASGATHLKWKALGRLAGRGESLLPAERVRAFPLFGLEYKWRVRRSRTAEARTAAWLWGGQRFCELAQNELKEGCDSVYAFTSAAKELFERARAMGHRTCLDHATAPRRAEMALVHEEFARFPGWSLHPEEDGLIDAYHARQRAELALADVVVCGSSFVRRLVAAEGIAPERLRTVPLGIAPRAFAPDQRPPVGGALRVLFVGGDGLRKGIGYLAQAVERLASRHIETRVAGDLEISPAGVAQLRQSLTLLGAVPRTEIDTLFRWADVLVLPSISDTFGLVILEAMAAGLPVITTPNTCGPDVIREGVDGFVVPIRDPDAIAERLEQLAAQPDLLRALSANAIARIQDYSIEWYGKRLIAACAASDQNGATHEPSIHHP